MLKIHLCVAPLGLDRYSADNLRCLTAPARVVTALRALLHQPIHALPVAGTQTEKADNTYEIIVADNGYRHEFLPGSR